MNDTPPQYPDVGPPPSPNPAGYVRALLRLAGALTFSVACAALALLIAPVGWVAPGCARSIQRGLSRRWMRGVLWFTGTRIVIQGAPPKAPYLFVFNHPCWLDFFVFTTVLPDARFVAEAPLRTAPIAGILVRGLNPLFVKRTQEDTARIIADVTGALRAGDSVAFAPETPVFEVPRGTVVRQFRAALFEAAIQAGMPVSCGSVTYRTPAGCPAAFKAVIFHTAAIYRPAGSDMPDANLESYGADKIRDFFRYLVGLLALPHHEAAVTFAETAVTAEDRIALANRAHDAVAAIFVPME